ncbi:hypothetical protein JIN77_04325 [Verrucomicrobiaceae bacterium R5-34]|uniref:Uncharacterized protein n=1 Tax=Oceaniferula flava TaxID=2800421 RepID=A0AAE2SB61_9BACT|nr:hypothetical protein [Oceaniferula flavus]MBK1829939.1 hypothetical protein [Verrucomicrobiaceae bacterium R5-34]MBK1855213.1 hypothetical protein [Oceaniferula flavus]MBM1136519.1 hypothetical protein [Oceaniferula flavus]
MQLQAKKKAFDQLGVEMVCVFREERGGLAGAKKTADSTGFSPLLLDYPIAKTKAYSQGSYSTYLIGKDGKIKAELNGLKKNRPTADAIAAKVSEVFKPTPTKP